MTAHIESCKQHLARMTKIHADFIASNPNCCTTCYGGGCECCHGNGLCPFCMSEARRSCSCGWDEKTWVRFDRKPPNETFDCVCVDDFEDYEFKYSL